MLDRCRYRVSGRRGAVTGAFVAGDRHGGDQEVAGVVGTRPWCAAPAPSAHSR